MNWKTRKSIERVAGVFNRNKGKVYAQDIEALKHINGLLEAETEQIVNDHLLFAKLLAHVMRLHLIQLGDMQMAVKRTSEVLSSPLSHSLEFLKLQINESDRRQFFDSLGFDTKATGIDKDETAMLKQHEKAILAKIKNEWNDEKIRKSFHNTAEAMIKNVNNYV